MNSDGFSPRHGVVEVSGDPREDEHIRHWPNWALNLMFGDGRTKLYGVLSEPVAIPDRETRQQRRHAARAAAKH